MNPVEKVLAEQLATGYKYQQFGYTAAGLVPEEKCRLKLRAWGTHFSADLTGMRVLDVGCNLGFFTFLAAAQGASKAVGVDVDQKRLDWARRLQSAVLEQHPSHDYMRNVTFFDSIYNVGGPYDLILLWSVYHHLFKTKQSHDYWFDFFRSLLARGGKILFEGPFHSDDYIIRRLGIHTQWARETLFDAMSRWFKWTLIGPSLHTGGREAVVLCALEDA